MQSKFDALQNPDTQKQDPIDNVIKTKWIFRVKQKEDGSIEHYKGHLVTNGTRQVHDTNYMEAFSPMAKCQSPNINLNSYASF